MEKHDAAPLTPPNYCGLNHAASYRRNTGRLPTFPRIQRINQSCQSWHRELVKVQAGTPGLADHALVGRFWDAHMADLGAEG